MARPEATSASGGSRTSRTAPKPSAARARILATAGRLFYRTGIRAVGVDRVIAESAVARMTFFRHFPTKDDLVVAFLEAQESASRQSLLQLRDRPDGARAVLAAVAAEVAIAPTNDGFRGCEFINTAAEFADPGHPARLVVSRHRAWIRDRICDALTELGHPRPRATAELLLMLRTGAVVAASLEGYVDVDGDFERTWWELIDRPGPPDLQPAGG